MNTVTFMILFIVISNEAKTNATKNELHYIDKRMWTPMLTYLVQFGLGVFIMVCFSGGK